MLSFDYLLPGHHRGNVVLSRTNITVWVWFLSMATKMINRTLRRSNRSRELGV